MGGASTQCQVAGYWYSAGMHMVFCTGVDELLTIVAGEREIWTSGGTDYIFEWTPTPYCRYTDDYRGAFYQQNGYITREVKRGTFTPTTVDPCSCPEPENMECVPHYTQVRVPVTQPVVTSNRTINIYKKDIFGGEEREGGVEGAVDVEFGHASQGRNPYLTAHLGGNIPAHRGVFGFVLKDVTVSCNSPNIKPWSIRARRTNTGFAPAHERIGDDMNPIHIVEECLFSAQWGGVALPVSKRGSSFETAAASIYAEQFGLSFLWTQNESIENFIDMALRHIDAVLYQDYETGKLEIKLIRDDYGDPSGLPRYDTSNILSLEDFDAKSTAELVNTVVIKYRDPRNGKDQSLTLTDRSAVDRNGGVVSVMEREFYGVSRGDLASKIGMRELKAAILPLATVTFMANRKAFKHFPGDVINFTWAPIGFENAAMRVVSIDLGTLDASAIRVDAALDVFSFGDSVLEEPPDSGNWEDPIQDPGDLMHFTVRELTWWDVSRNPNNLVYINDKEDTSLHITAEKPFPIYSNFELWDRLESQVGFTLQDVGSFSEVFTVTNEIDAEIESEISLDTPVTDLMISSGAIAIGAHAYLNDEIVSLVAINSDKTVLTVSRGIVDTVPQSHDAGGVLQFVSNSKCAFDRTPYKEGMEINFKLLPSTMNGRLHIDDATEHSYTFTGRLNKPYPPGNVKFCGARYPEFAIGESSAVAEIRPVEFNADVVKATTTFSSSYYPWYALDPNLSLEDSYVGTQWISANGVNTNQKFNIDLGSETFIASMILNNSHSSGASTADGIADFEVYGTNDIAAFEDTDYSNTAGLTLLGTFTAAQHIASNEPDPQLFIFAESGAYQYIVLRIANNHGGAYMGIRDIYFSASGSPGGFSLEFAHRNRLQQTTYTADQSVGSIGPEENVTYNIEIYDIDNDVVVESSTGSDATFYAFTNLIDVGFVRVSIEAERDDEGTIRTSHQKHEFETRLVGYGKNYGYCYGGLP